MGNVAQTKIAVSKPQFNFVFSAGSLSQAATGTLLPSGITGATYRQMPSAGSVYGMSASYSAALTAGTVTLTPSINGTPVQALQITNAAANAKGVYGIKQARVANFNAGDTLSLIYTTAGLNSAGIGIITDVLCFFESIEF